MIKQIQRILGRSKQKIHRRLDSMPRGDLGHPVMTASNIQYDCSTKTSAINAGGIGAIHLMARRSGLIESIDNHVSVLKYHLPYHESDHVLNVAYNLLSGGQALDDIELRRQDEVYLDALGAVTIPDPTTEGDFCRRFDEASNWALMNAINEARLKIWRQQPAEFFQQKARIDADGTQVVTLGECKEGMDISHKGEWGYHPLLLSLANTNESLFLLNRSGNRPSHEGAPELFDRSAKLCREAGFREILFRGDTDFSLTRYFDRWDEEGNKFVFGLDAHKKVVDRAVQIEDDEYFELVRHGERALKTAPRRKPENVKEQIIKERGYLNRKLDFEQYTEFDYKPLKCEKTYRVVVLQKNITAERGELALFDEIKYFFYITNDRQMSAEEVIRESNQRCNQENLISQLKNGVRALRAPVNTLNANWAYMIMASLAWNLKAWMALSLPVSPRWAEKHEKEKASLLKMEFRKFLNVIMLQPCQIIKTGRKIVYRLLAWNPWQPVFFRFVNALRL